MHEEFTMFFKKLGALTSLKNVEFETSVFKDFSAFDLGKNFNAIDLRIFGALGAQQCSLLPSGQGVKCLGIQQISHHRRPLTLQALDVLKKKYPNLEVLILPYGSEVEGSTHNVGLRFFLD